MTDTTTASLTSSDPLLRIVLFAIIVFLAIAILWALPGWLRRARSSYRPGDPWVGDPLWIGAPAGALGEQPALASEPASVAQTTLDGRGGASAQW